MPRKKPAAPAPKPRKARKADQKPAPDQDAGFVAIPDSMALVPIKPKKKGRPTLMTAEVVSELLRRATGRPITQVCRDVDMPAYRTVAEWAEKHETFSASLAHARTQYVHSLVDEVPDIIDGNDELVMTPEGKWIRPKDSMTKIARAKLRVWGRLEYARVMLPRLYDMATVKGQIEHENELAQADLDDEAPEEIRMVGVVAPRRDRV